MIDACGTLWITSPEEMPLGVPFVACCACGMDCDQMAWEAAILAGWSDFCYDPDGMSWNFVGHCPDCTAENAVWHDHKGEPVKAKKKRRRK